MNRLGGFPCTFTNGSEPVVMLAVTNVLVGDNPIYEDLDSACQLLIGFLFGVDTSTHSGPNVHHILVTRGVAILYGLGSNARGHQVPSTHNFWCGAAGGLSHHSKLK